MDTLFPPQFGIVMSIIGGVGILVLLSSITLCILKPEKIEKIKIVMVMALAITILAHGFSFAQSIHILQQVRQQESQHRNGL